MKKIKVLICDDSRIMRKLITNVIETDERIDVVGQAENGVDCLEKVVQFQPDVVSLDLNMPVMDGLTVLRESKARGLKATYLVVSSLAKKDAQITLDAITEGAIDFILKPSQAFNIASMGKEVIEKILIAALQAKKLQNLPEEDVQAAPESGGPEPAGPEAALPPEAEPAAPAAVVPASVEPGAPPAPAAPSVPTAAPGSSATAPAARPSSTLSGLEEKAARLLQQLEQTKAAAAASAAVGLDGVKLKAVQADVTVIGGSSGAIQTLLKIIPFLPPGFSSSIVLVLHLPPFFTTQFTQQLNHKCPVPVEEASDGLTLMSKKVYIAPGGDKNLVLRKGPDGQAQFKLVENDANMMYTPSIDILMTSVAELYKEKCRGVLISGTGTDGVEGLRSVKNSGGTAFVQDKATAIANQLPFAALKAGVVDKALSIQDILNLFS